MTGDRPRPEREVLDYYGRGKERGRLEAGYGPLERERTREILSRVLPRPPATVADVGAGAGVHALWLAPSGYSRHLRDPVPLHVEQAGPHHGSWASGSPPSGSETRGSWTWGRPQSTRCCCSDRSTTCRRPSNGGRRWGRRTGSCAGGILAVAAISRWAPVLDGLKLGLLEDGGHLGALDRAQETGRFDPPPQSGFTRAAAGAGSLVRRPV